MPPPDSAWPAWQAHLFDADRVPFSRRESFLAVSRLDDGAHWLRSVRGGDEHTDDGRLFRLTPLDAAGQPVAGSWRMLPDQLRFDAPAGYVALAFADADTLAVAGHGLGLRLSMQPKTYDYAQSLADAIHVSNARQDLTTRIGIAQGSARLDAPWQGLRAERIELDLNPADGRLAAALHVYRVQPARADVAGFDLARADAAADFTDWLAATLPVAAGFEPGRLLAAYLTWSCLVPAEGALTQPAMYMSKNWMTNIWSWDHCFNALALGRGQPARAWQQLAAIFDHQHAGGRLPDFVNDRFAYWRFTKPPVHGWTVGQLRRMAPQAWPRERCETAYRWLAAQAESWMAGALDGLPVYDHGNDAGWDNATVFLHGTPLASPDLAALLVTQMAELAELAVLLDMPQAAADWRAQADALTARLIDRLWSGDRFVARRGAGKVLDGGAVEAGDSLIAFVPLLLGNRLPAAIRDTLLAGLWRDGRFLTAHGLATESTASPHYRDDGYWRGPIWAPATLLFVDALDRCGHPELGDELARRFLRMANTAGMAENFDARSGAGLRDPAFTWTSSVFLLLGNRLTEKASHV